MLNITQEELQKFIKMLEPARLADTVENAAAISSYVKKHNLPHTAQSCYQAVNELLFTDAFTWDVKPQKVLAAAKNAKPQNKMDVMREIDEFNARKQASEKTDAEKVTGAQFEKDTEALIESYTPVVARGIAYGAQSAAQNSLRKYVAAEKARGVSAETTFKIVREHIEKLYADAEKARERV